MEQKPKSSSNKHVDPQNNPSFTSSSDQSQEEVDNIQDELADSLNKFKIILKRALYTFAYYKFSRYLLNLISTKVFNQASFFQWNIFGFAQKVAIQASQSQ